MSKKGSIFAAVMKRYCEVVIVVALALVVAAIVFLECMQVKVLRVIAERETPAIVVSDDGQIDHGEQRGDNQVTIMFNYE